MALRSPVTDVRIAPAIALANTRHGDEARRPFEAGFETRVPGGYDRARDRRELVTFLRALGVAVPAQLPTREQTLRLVRLREAARALAEGDLQTYEKRLARASEGILYRLDKGRLRSTANGWDGLIAEAVVGLDELRSVRDRVKICANVACSWLFVDPSPTNRQIFCAEQRCAVRVRVRRFRLKRARTTRAGR